MEDASFTDRISSRVHIDRFSALPDSDSSCLGLRESGGCGGSVSGGDFSGVGWDWTFGFAA